MKNIDLLYQHFQNDAYVSKKIDAYKWYITGKLKVNQIGVLLGIHRSTVYRWINQVRKVVNRPPHEWRKLRRHYKEYTQNLGRRSIIGGKLVMAVFDIRERYLCGKNKIAIYLQREYGIKVSASTVGRILNRYRSIDPRRRILYKRKVKSRRIRKNVLRPWDIPKDLAPLEAIQIDTKYYTITKGGKRYYIYAAIDIRTRMLFAMFYKKIDSNNASDFLERVLNFFSGYRQVRYVQTDNGSEFMGKFEKILQDRGIKHVYSQAARPYQNGRVERVMRILQEEFLPRIEGIEDINRINLSLLEFLVYYNTYRVHTALNYKTPVEYMLELLNKNVATLLNPYSPCGRDNFVVKYPYMKDKKQILEFLHEVEQLKLPHNVIERELNIPLNTDFIISVIGPRRAGKTYYLLWLKNRLPNALYLNFEDTRLAGLKDQDLREIIRIYAEEFGALPQYLLLDEVQNLHNWHAILRELHDFKKYKIVVTGSSSKVLSKEIATQLRGRTLSYWLLPFSFTEFLRAQGVSPQLPKTGDESAILLNYLSEYMEFGGFPEVVFAPKDLKPKILSEYTELILFKDFVERHNIGNLSVARFIFLELLNMNAKETSVRRIYNKLKSMQVSVSKDTVYNYIDKLEDTALFFWLKRYANKPHLRGVWPKKVYVVDTGLVKVVKSQPDLGKLLESLVFLHLFRSRNTAPLIEFYYLSGSILKPFKGETPQGSSLLGNNGRIALKEVDFVIKEAERITELIQVSYVSYEHELNERELKALYKAYRVFKPHNPKLTLITWNLEKSFHLEGDLLVSAVPFYKWLLQREGQ